VNEHEQDLFEAELRQLQPAKLPEDLAARLAAARLNVAALEAKPSADRRRSARWLPLLRWLAPATAAAAATLALVVWLNRPDGGRPETPLHAVSPRALQADAVEIDRQLIGAFEAIATLPDGEPVRLRVREWMDEVVLRDTAHGVAVQQRSPRIEVIPVSFETF
jgi:hypothetical protein